MKKKIHVELVLGFTAPSLANQLRRQRLAYDPKQLRIFNEHFVAIQRLAVHSLITAEERRKAVKRLWRKILDHVKEMNQ